MKKKILAVFFVLALFACNHSDDDGKDLGAMFLPSILSREGQVLTLTFDDQHRIVQLGEVADNSESARLYTFNYSGGKLVTAQAIYFSTVVVGGYNYTEDFKFEYIQDRVLVEKKFLDSSGYATTINTVLYVDAKGNLLHTDGIEISYDDRGNMTKVVNNGNVTEVSYDNKNGSFLNVKTPQWALYFVMRLGNFYRINNPIGVKSYPVGMDTEILIERVFEYNEYDYPVKFSEKTTSADQSVSFYDYYIDYIRLYTD